MGSDAPGLFASVKKLAATLVSIARTRVELLSVEIEEEVERLASLLFGAVVSLFFLGIAIILIAILIVAAFWENRLVALAFLALFFSVMGFFSASLFLKKARSRSRLFSQSLDELGKDLSELE